MKNLQCVYIFEASCHFQQKSQHLKVLSDNVISMIREKTLNQEQFQDPQYGDPFQQFHHSNRKYASGNPYSY